MHGARLEEAPSHAVWESAWASWGLAASGDGSQPCQPGVTMETGTALSSTDRVRRWCPALCLSARDRIVSPRGELKVLELQPTARLTTAHKRTRMSTGSSGPVHMKQLPPDIFVVRLTRHRLASVLSVRPCMAPPSP